MTLDILADSTKTLAVLVNCRKERNVLRCGAAMFRGGLSGTIVVGNEFNSFTIKIPEAVSKSATREVYADSQDLLEFDLA